jgi:hypothetical protein
MNLEVTLSVYGGGPGSGCVGPNCGRPKINFSQVSRFEGRYVSGLMTRDGKIVMGNQPHEGLLKDYRLNDNGTSDFLAKGGIRFGLGNGGFVEVGNRSKEVIGTAMKLLEAMPRVLLRFEYRPDYSNSLVRTKSGYLAEKDKYFYSEGELSRVQRDVSVWQARLNEEQSN